MIINLTNRLLNYLADDSVKWSHILATFTAVVIFRTVLELLLESDHSVILFGGTIQDLVTYLHIYLAWFCTFSIFTVILRLFLPLDTLQAGRLVCLLSPVIWIVPIIDVLITGGAGGEIRYGMDWDDFTFNFIHLFNPFANIEMVTTGVRIEIFLACISALIFPVFIFKIKFGKALIIALLIYSTIFFLGYLPAIYRWFYLGFGLDPAQTVMTTPADYFYMYIPLFIFLLCALFYLMRKDAYTDTRIIMWLLFPSRLLFYILLLGIGYILALHGENSLAILRLPENIFKLMSATLSIGFLFAFSRITNDIYDIEIDRHSNKTRPIASGELPIQSAKMIGYVFLFTSLIFAVPTEPEFLAFWAAIAAIAYLYSSPPLRLRRFYPVSILVLSTIGCLLYIAGASLSHSDDLYGLLSKQGLILPLFFAFFSLSHIKDLKDIEGDQLGGVQNLFAWINFRKTMSLGFVAGFYLALAVIMHRLDLTGFLELLITIVFFAGTAAYIYFQNDIRKLDKIITFSLIITSLISFIWILKAV